MKTSLFVTLLFTLLFVLGLNAQVPDIKISDDVDKEDYLKAVNVVKDIPYGERTLDVYYSEDEINQSKPVVIFIYGGSWVGGSKVIYTNFGSLLESEDYVAVLPNYVLFPNGTIEDMVDDVYKAIQWTYNNIAKYGGNPNKITISAHSAGSHITFLTILKAALGLANNGVALKPLPYLEKAVLLNGPYIFDQEFLAYTLKGTQDVSQNSATTDPAQMANLQQLMMRYYNDSTISPIEILKGYEDKSISSLNVGKFVFFYTSHDNVVPESSAKNLIAQIERTSSVKYDYVFKSNFDHATLIRGVRNSIPEYENIFMELIRY